MTRLTLNDLSKIKNGELAEPEGVSEKTITGVSIDSRSIEPGNMFFAIKGEKFDGHAFLNEVRNKKASGIVVEYNRELPEGTGWDETVVLRVPDTTKALGELAGIHRKKFDIPLAAVTGTNGKTTTKEFIYSVLSKEYRTLKSEGNYNNLYGLPLTLFKLTSSTEAAVVELGASYPGEIAKLCDIALPTIGVITNIGKGHLEFFGSEDEVLRTKTALLDAVKDHGQGFVNGDDPRLLPLKKQYRNVQTFGLGENNDYRGADLKMQSNGSYDFTLDSLLKVRLQQPGKTTVYSALAAASVGLSIGMERENVLSGLESFSSAEGSLRMEVSEWNGVTIINDSYNANPDSMRTALEFLMEYSVKSSPGKRFAVLGDMLELGKISDNEHQKLGEYCASAGIDRLITVGNKASSIAQGAKTGGMQKADHFHNHQEAARSLASEIRPGDVVLIKGSRGSKMENVLQYLN